HSTDNYRSRKLVTKRLLDNRRDRWSQREVEVLFYPRYWPANSEGGIARGMSRIIGRPCSSGGVHDILVRLRNRGLVGATELTDEGTTEFQFLLSRFMWSTRYPTDTIWDSDRDRGKGDRLGQNDPPCR